MIFNPFRMTQSFIHGNILGKKDQKYGEIYFKINQNGKANIPYAHSGSSDCKGRVRPLNKIKEIY